MDWPRPAYVPGRHYLRDLEPMDSDKASVTTFQLLQAADGVRSQACCQVIEHIEPNELADPGQSSIGGWLMELQA